LTNRKKEENKNKIKILRSVNLILFLFGLNIGHRKVISKGVNDKYMTRIVAFGIKSTIFERGTGRWTALPDMLTSWSASPALCLVGNKVILAGGWSGDKDDYPTAVEYLDLDVDVEEMKWAVVPTNLQFSRCSWSGVVLDDGVTFLVTGGEFECEVTESCEQLDTTTMTWSNAPSMANARYKHQTVLYKKKAVVIGGRKRYEKDEKYDEYTGKDDDDDLLLCEEYDTTSQSKKWSPFPSLIHRRFGHGACVLDDRIYVCGGQVNFDLVATIASVEMFDGMKWSVLDSSLSVPRSGHACVVWGGKIAVLGGGQEKVEVYNKTKRKWEFDVIPNMPCDTYLNAVSF
jgi:hypothetical protein